MWDNAELLRSLSHVLVWVAIIAALAAAGATGGRYYIDRRLATLNRIDQEGKDRQRNEAHDARETELKNAADSARRIAEEERQARLELAARMADRSMSSAQEADVARAIARYAGQKFTVTTFADDPEATGLTTQIHRTLVNAKWVAPTGRGGSLWGVEFGVSVSIRKDSSPETSAAAAALANALRDAGIASEVITKYQHDEPIVHVRVGKKPR